jgi:hypothetical protein
MVRIRLCFVLIYLSETKHPHGCLTEQDTQLETLSHSIRRQRELSENIGNELDVHTGLLEDLESGLDNTAIRLGGARRKLDAVAKGARDNCEYLCSY